jgi:hypothetical protein
MSAPQLDAGPSRFEGSPSSPRSPSQLILVQDPEEHPELELWQDDSDADDDDLEEAGDSQRPTREEGALPPLDASTPPISPWLLVPLLLASSLKLGAILLVQSSQIHALPLPIPVAVVCLVMLGVLSPVVTQINLLLGRYVKRWTIEGVVGAAVIGVRNTNRRTEQQERWKERTMTVTKVAVIITGSLLCAAYLRGEILPSGIMWRN